MSPSRTVPAVRGLSARTEARGGHVNRQKRLPARRDVRTANISMMEAYLVELELETNQAQVGEVPVEQNSSYGENAYINSPIVRVTVISFYLF